MPGELGSSDSGVSCGVQSEALGCVMFAKSHQEGHPDPAALAELQEALHRYGSWWIHPEVAEHLVPERDKLDV